MTLARPLAAAALAILVPVIASARQTPTKSTPTSATGIRAEMVANLDEVEQKLLDLAEATPPEKYTWRPSKDVRSISEVYMHIASSNYFLATFVGAPAPKAAGDPEKTITRKADVIAELKKSFDDLRTVVLTAPDLDKAVKLFGNQTTRRGVLLTIVSHLHEHLGQSIAYARMNGIVPPWSH
jgi:uncharacterized damage-inducible protein DinB